MRASDSGSAITFLFSINCFSSSDVLRLDVLPTVLYRRGVLTRLNKGDAELVLVSLLEVWRFGCLYNKQQLTVEGSQNCPQLSAAAPWEAGASSIFITSFTT